MFARPGTSALASTKWIQTRMYHLFYPPNNGVGLVAYLAFFWHCIHHSCCFLEQSFGELSNGPAKELLVYGRKGYLCADISLILVSK